MPANLDMELLRSLVAIADHGGFTRAAERLHRSQSTVSLQIKRLERQAGVPLFRREGRRARLTEQGETLLVQARRILELNDQALAGLGRARLEGGVRVGSAQAFTERALPQLLARFARLHPGVRLEVRVDAQQPLAAAVAAGELDLALAIQPTGSGGESLGRVPLTWAVPGTDDWREAPELPLALFESPCPFRDLALQALETARIPWRVAFTSPSLPGLFAAVRAGLALTAQPRLAIPADLNAVSRDARLPPLPRVEVALYRRSPCPNPAAAQLAQALEQALETIVGTPLP